MKGAVVVGAVVAAGAALVSRQRRFERQAVAALQGHAGDVNRAFRESDKEIARAFRERDRALEHLIKELGGEVRR